MAKYKTVMLKSYEIIRPADVPYALLSFKFFFENINTHIVDMYHASGMNLVYNIEKTCYVPAKNEFYQLLKLQNKEEPHIQKYNWLLMKGIFSNVPKIEADIEIENEEIVNLLQPDNHFNKSQLLLHRLPEHGNEMVIADIVPIACFHHFVCNEVLPGSVNYSPFINLNYLNSYNSSYQAVNRWCNEETKLAPLT
jgi:hypothetical protein